MEIHDASDHFRSTQSGEFGLTMRVHVTVVSGAVLISRPHLSRSSPHVQPIGTSQLGYPKCLRESGQLKKMRPVAVSRRLKAVAGYFVLECWSRMRGVVAINSR